MNSPQRTLAGSLAVILVFFGLGAHRSGAYEVETHEMISRSAVRDSEVDRLLRDALGLPDGRNTQVKGRSVEARRSGFPIVPDTPTPFKDLPNLMRLINVERVSLGLEPIPAN